MGRKRVHEEINDEEKKEEKRNLEDLTLNELKDILRELGKKVGGKKSELIKRIRENQNENNEKAKEEEKEEIEEITKEEEEKINFVINKIDNINFISFDWFNLPNVHNEWSGRSIIPLDQNEFYYWEVNVANFDKKYQYAYTKLGIITEDGEKFVIDGSCGILHYMNGLLRGMDKNTFEEHRFNCSTSTIQPNKSIELKHRDTVGFLLDNRDPCNRSLVVVPRQNYTVDSESSCLQPFIGFSTPLLKVWEGLTDMFDRTSLPGRIPKNKKLYAYASVGQLGKRFEKKLLSNLQQYVYVQKWCDPDSTKTKFDDDNNDNNAIIPSPNIKFLLANPITTLSSETLSTRTYDERLLAKLIDE